MLHQLQSLQSRQESILLYSKFVWTWDLKKTQSGPKQDQKAFAQEHDSWAYICGDSNRQPAVPPEPLSLLLWENGEYVQQ